MGRALENRESFPSQSDLRPGQVPRKKQGKMRGSRARSDPPIFHLSGESVIYLFILGEWHMPSTHVAVRDQPSEVSCLLLPHGSLGLNSGQQDWRQSPLPAGPSHRPGISFFSFLVFGAVPKLHTQAS